MDGQSVLAAEMLLDMGIEIPLKTRRLGIVSVTMRRPTLGTMMRIAREYAKIGSRFENVEKMNIDEQMAFVAEHGDSVSRIVAYAVCSGRIAGGILNGAVAWWLRRNVHPAFLFQAMLAFVRGSRVRAFCNIIPLAREIAELLKPIGSHEEKMS